MDVKITDLSALMPKSITILDDPDASTITISAPENKITVATEQLKVTTSSETMASIGDVNITSLADNQILAYDSTTSKWVNEAQGSAPVTSVNTETGAVVLDTDDISEGSTNLYYTNARFDTQLATKSTTNLSEGTNLYYTTGRFDTALGTKSTTNLTEGTNLYYTDARVLTKINATDLDALSDVHTATPSDGQVLTWDNGNSRWAPAASGTAPVTSVNTETGAVVLDTDDIAEGSTNLYYTNARFDTRFDTQFGTKSTTNLSEGSNLYYTDTRARASNSVTTATAGDLSALSYDSGTGTFTFTPADVTTRLPLAGGTMTGNIVMSGTETVDGVDISARDAILTSTTTTANAALPKAGGTMTGNIVMGGTDTVDGVDISARDAILTSTTTTAGAALPKAGGTMSGAIAMGTEKITGMGDPTANQDAATKLYVDTETAAGGGAVTSYTNGTDNRIVTSTGAAGINAESGMTFDGSNAVISGSSGGLTTPILELETDNSGWNKPVMMLKDSNGDAVSIVGEHNTTADLYLYNFTLDPNNTHGRTGSTTWAGDYFIGFAKNYSDQSEISMDMNVYGAHDGFNITVLDDFNGNSPKYSAKPINLKGNEINLFSSDTSTPFGNFTKQVTVRPDAVDIEIDIKLDDSKALQFDDAGTTVTYLDKDEISAKGSFLVNVDSDNSGNESFIIQSAGTDALQIARGPGGDTELTVKNSDGVFFKDENDNTVFSMDLSSATSSGINVIRTDENKVLSLTLKTDDNDDTGNYDGSWNFRQEADNKSLILERVDGSAVDIFKIRDSADVATAAPVDIFEFKIPPVLPSYVVASLPTTVVAGAQAFCTDETGGAVNVFSDGTNWRRCTDRAIAS